VSYSRDANLLHDFDARAPPHLANTASGRDEAAGHWQTHTMLPNIDTSWRRVTTTGDDFEEARAFHEARYNGHNIRLSPSGRTFKYSYSVAGDQNITLRKSILLAHGHGTIAPENDYVVSWVTAGIGAFDTTQADIPATTLPAVYPHARPFDFVYENVTQNLVHIDAHYLERRV
jgi:hypothetical protein